MERKKLLKEYFSFSRKDRIGVIVLITLIFVVFFLPKFFTGPIIRANHPADTAWIAATRQLEVKETTGKDESYRRKNDDGQNTANYQYDRTISKPVLPAGKLFPFDPNTLAIAGWKELGVREKTIGIILNYLSKGGHFKKPEDLQRIYGLHDDDYHRLLPYIQIAVTDRPVYDKDESTHHTASSFHYSIVDINTADTAAFISLPGIGNKLAARIVSFREKLGGFYSITQVEEIYGLADSVFQKIKSYLQLNNPAVKKININTATADELKNHPYIRYTLANPIIAYRKEHGPFAQTEDLKKVMAVTEEAYNKIAPYVTTN